MRGSGVVVVGGVGWGGGRQGHALGALWTGRASAESRHRVQHSSRRTRARHRPCVHGSCTRLPEHNAPHFFAPEVLHSLGHSLAVEAHHNAARRLAVNLNVEKHLQPAGCTGGVRTAWLEPRSEAVQAAGTRQQRGHQQQTTRHVMVVVLRPLRQTAQSDEQALPSKSLKWAATVRGTASKYSSMGGGGGHQQEIAGSVTLFVTVGPLAETAAAKSSAQRAPSSAARAMAWEAAGDATGAPGSDRGAVPAIGQAHEWLRQTQKSAVLCHPAARPP